MSKALLVIDCQNGFMPDGESPVIDLPIITNNILKIFDVWKDKIIFTKYIYRPSPNKLIDINPELCVDGTYSAEIVDELQNHSKSKNSLVLKKHT